MNQLMKKDKLAYLEGLRGVAALMVVLCHLRYTFAISSTDTLLEQLKQRTDSYLLSYIVNSIVNIMFDGNLAVYIFWFMSAYVISIKLFMQDDSQYLFQSFSKRYFRLMLPALGSILFALSLLHFGLMYNSQLAQKLGTGYQNGWLGSFYQFDANILEAVKSGLWNTFFNYDDRTSYNASLWTMNPELYGSMFCFLLFGVVGNNRYRHMFYLIIMCGTFILKTYWLTSFLFGFFMCDINYSKPNWIKKTIDFLTQNKFINTVIFICLIIIGGKSNYFGFFDLFISSLIVIIIMRTFYLQQLLQNAFMVWLGKISFSLYLIHLPLICSFSCYLYLTLNLEHQTKVLLISSLTIALALFISYIFTKFIDKNAVVFANKFASWLTKPD